MTTLPYQLARRSNPKRLLAALTVCIAVFALLGLAQAHVSPYNLQAFKLAIRTSTPGSACRPALRACCWGCRRDGVRALRAWSTAPGAGRGGCAGLALLVLAVEELLGVHSWLRTGASRGRLATCRWSRLRPSPSSALCGSSGPRRTQALFGVGRSCSGWSAAALDNPTIRRLLPSAAEIIEMAAGVLFVVALLARCKYLAAQYYPLEEPETRLSVDQIAAEVLDRVKFRPILIGILLATAAFGDPGRAPAHGQLPRSPRVPVLDLNTEQTLWATFQGSLIFCRRADRDPDRPPAGDAGRDEAVVAAAGGVLMVLGLDEIVAIHDRFQDATGHPGQIVLIPVAIIGVVAWWKVLSEISDNGWPATVHRRRGRLVRLAGESTSLSSTTSLDDHARGDGRDDRLDLLAPRPALLAAIRAARRPEGARSGRRAC